MTEVLSRYELVLKELEEALSRSQAAQEEAETLLDIDPRRKALLAEASYFGQRATAWRSELARIRRGETTVIPDEEPPDDHPGTDIEGIPQK